MKKYYSLLFIIFVIVFVLIIMLKEEKNINKNISFNNVAPMSQSVLNEPENKILCPDYAIQPTKINTLINFNNKNDLQNNIDFYQEQLSNYDKILNNYSKYLTEDYKIYIMQNYNIIYEEYNYLQSLLDKRKVQEQKKYPVAFEIWEYLKSLGFNDYVTAGILGNMMAESGGQTLKIDPYNYDSTNCYYGICQWNKWSHGKLFNSNLKTQLNYLKNTIEREFNVYGHKFKKGFNYESFLELTDEKEAALAFAKVYERCGSGSYNIRQINATKALDYFIF